MCKQPKSHPRQNKLVPVDVPGRFKRENCPRDAQRPDEGVGERVQIAQEDDSVRPGAGVELALGVEAVDGAEVEEFLDHDEDYHHGVVDYARALGGGLDVEGLEGPGVGEDGEGGGGGGRWDVGGDVCRGVEDSGCVGEELEAG